MTLVLSTSRALSFSVFGQFDLSFDFFVFLANIFMVDFIEICIGKMSSKISGIAFFTLTATAFGIRLGVSLIAPVP